MLRRSAVVQRTLSNNSADGKEGPFEKVARIKKFLSTDDRPGFIARLRDFAIKGIRDGSIRRVFEGYNKESDPAIAFSVENRNEYNEIPNGYDRLGFSMFVRVAVQHHPEIQSEVHLQFGVIGQSGTIFSKWVVNINRKPDPEKYQSDTEKIFTFQLDQYNEAVLRDEIHSIVDKLLAKIEGYLRS